MTKTYIKDDIINILTKNNGYYEESGIIERIRDKHKEELAKLDNPKNEKKLRIGYSPLTIRRRIGELVGAGTITVIKDDKELEKYGMHRTDKRSAVLMLTKAKSEEDYLNSIFNKFSGSKNKTEVLYLIEETELSKEKILVSSVNLSILSSKLNIKDGEIQRRIVYILYDHATNGVFPQNVKEAALSIKKVLNNLKIPMVFFVDTKDNMTSNVGEKFNIYEYAVWLLVLYQSDYAIDELLKTAELLKKEDLPETTTPDRKRIPSLCLSEQNPFIRENVKAFIEKNKQRLFEAEQKYRESGNELAADYIFQIRRRIAALDKPPVPYFTPAPKHEG